MDHLDQMPCRRVTGTTHFVYGTVRSTVLDMSIQHATTTCAAPTETVCQRSSPTDTGTAWAAWTCSAPKTKKPTQLQHHLSARSARIPGPGYSTRERKERDRGRGNLEGDGGG